LTTFITRRLKGDLIEVGMAVFFNLFIGTEPFGAFRLLAEPKGLFYSKRTETAFFCT